MMKKTKILAGAALSACLVAVAAKDPVIMTVAGVDVPLSEFEYFYNKNNRQQVEKQTIDEYADVFKVYKLKVADALAQGIDTLPDFKREYAQYRHELAAPYLADSTYIKQLAREQYADMGEEVEAIHIMRFKVPDADGNRPSVNLMDSVHTLLVNGADFGEMAKAYSQDKGSLDNGGRIGFIAAGKFPYAFEKEVYRLKPGEISEVVESPMGYHIIKGGARRPARGKVLASHILVMAPENAPDSIQQRAKARADEMYREIKNEPSRFDQLAHDDNDDKQSARNGGKLPWFGAGEMVEEFDRAAFAMQPGDVSEPVRTRFGWHIIKVLDKEPVASYEKMYPELVRMVTSGRDFRSLDIIRRQLDKLQAEYKGKYNKENIGRIHEYIAANGIDSLFVEKALMPAGTVLYSYGKKNITSADLIPYAKYIKIADPEFARKEIDRRIEALVYTSLVSDKEEKLADEISDYGNLLREFRDGSLLYEAGKKKVWDRASQDKEGLEKYFIAHRSDYKWKDPKVKGLLIQTADDSISSQIRSRVKGLPNDSVINIVKKEFKGKAQVDRVLVSKGTNPMVDFVAFGGEKVKPSSSKYTDFFLYNYRTLTEPEEVSDVRGIVTGDYQNQLEAEWVEEIKSKYPVKINQKTLEAAKKKSAKEAAKKK